MGAMGSKGLGIPSWGSTYAGPCYGQGANELQPLQPCAFTALSPSGRKPAVSLEELCARGTAWPGIAPGFFCQLCPQPAALF